ncbi:hypothetical protein [Dyadobacter crusticola]|uniref:hypothetical protein n=1 Tax=Dyadobacter crusticola TaxID=292407 RepID=UPI00068C3BBC|nr:hypothetical protein [Dyadobacter crusticola]
MKISSIFVVVPYSLYTVRFGSEARHEFARLFAEWNDALYLEEFFETHKRDLEEFWRGVTVEDAVLRTRHEAARLEKRLLTIAERGMRSKYEGLSTLFRPLHNGTQRLDTFEKSKASGDQRQSWLRIYAVRVDVNFFIITGGAIKLTRTMNERAHLLKELRKLDAVVNYLRTDESDEFGIFELF